MKRLYSLRHGETEWNREKRMQGRLHSDLTDLGRAQVKTNGALLLDHGVEVVFASPLGRTRQTVAILNRHLDAPGRLR